MTLHVSICKKIFQHYMVENLVVDIERNTESQTKMKFSDHLSTHITPEWRKQYINYEEMKSLLYQAVDEAPAEDNVEEDITKRHFANFDESFFNYCDNELKKINTFYSEKSAEATRKFATLNNELKVSLEAIQKAQKKKNQFLGKKLLPYRKAQEFKLGFSEFYLSLILLQNFQTLNHTGFRKILKKHDKLLRVDIGAQWQKEKVETSHFFTNRDIDKIITETEAVVTSELESGDRQRAMKRLRVPPLSDQQSLWTTFKVGLFSGSFLVLFVAVILSAFFFANNKGRDEDMESFERRLEILKMAFRFYRGPFLIIMFLFLIGINIYGWRSSGCNHVLIFELDPRHHLSEQHLMEIAAIFGVVWCFSILSFLYTESLSLPPYVNPLTLIIVMIIFECNPFRVFWWEARFWLMRTVGRIISAPFFYVQFADFWLADQLNSLVAALMDFEFLICYYAVNASDWEVAVDAQKCDDFYFRPIVNCLPAWFRFAQCLRRYRDSREAFPHLVDAVKYSTTFLVVFFATLRDAYNSNYENIFDNPFTYCWLVSHVISSSYALIWDLKMDWGFFDKNAGENTFLREEIVYSSSTIYYFAIIEDVVLRFIWALSFILTGNNFISVDLMTSILAPLEVFRRFVWNFFRLENEHLNNCGKFRAVRDISIAPIDSSDQTSILRMMDEPDGVVNRYTLQNRPKQNKTTRDIEKRPLISTSLRSSFEDLTTIGIHSTLKNTSHTIEVDLYDT